MNQVNAHITTRQRLRNLWEGVKVTAPPFNFFCTGIRRDHIGTSTKRPDPEVAGKRLNQVRPDEATRTGEPDTWN